MVDKQIPVTEQLRHSWFNAYCCSMSQISDEPFEKKTWSHNISTFSVHIRNIRADVELCERRKH